MGSFLGFSRLVLAEMRMGFELSGSNALQQCLRWGRGTEGGLSGCYHAGGPG